MLTAPIRFKLSEALKIDQDGRFFDSDELLLFAPSRKDDELAIKLRSLITKAYLSISKQVNSNSADDNADNSAASSASDEENTDQISLVIYASDNPIDIFNAFKRLMCNGTCSKFENKADGKTRALQASYYDKLAFDDIQKLVGVYCSNFLIPASLKNSQTK